MNPAAAESFVNTSDLGIYKSVTIQSYRMDPGPGSYTESSEGLCVFDELPLHPDKLDAPGTPDLSKFYQYRVVDVREASPDFAYVTDEFFDRVVAVDIPEGAGHITKEIYLEETLDYKYIGAPEFNLEFDQLWNDSGMSDGWRDEHRPEAVRVAILYGVPLYEDVDKSTEYDITTEKGYYGEDVEVVWRNIQQIKYLTLYKNGDGTYAAYYPVWKYMSNGDPYFYKIRPISYSMNGTDFTPIDYWDADKIVPKLSLPEFYGIDTDTSYTDKSRVVFYEEEVAGDKTLYPKAVMYVDIPETAEIELTKTDSYNHPIIGRKASYEITNEEGKNLMFTLDSEGTYIYKGIEGTIGLPDDATKVITTSTIDSIVHATRLPLHAYSIREVEAPEGYQLSYSSIDVAILDFLASSTTKEGVKYYTSKKSQKDNRIPGPGPSPSPTPSPIPDQDTNSSSEIGPFLIPIEGLGLSTEISPDLTKSQTAVLGNIVGNNIKVENFIIDPNNVSGDTNINVKKLPKTGGLTGSLAAMILGIFMISFGIYLIKPTERKRNYRD